MSFSGGNEFGNFLLIHAVGNKYTFFWRVNEAFQEPETEIFEKPWIN